MRRAAILASLLLLAAGCSLGLVNSPPPTPKAPYTMPPPAPTISPIRTVAPTGHGRPYTAEMIALAMRDVPYNFPPQLRTPWLAAALAELIWTYDGQPYREVSFRARCGEGGPPRCDLTVTGLPGFAPTGYSRDTYWWVVTGSFNVLTPSGTGLRGYPPELTSQLDALARSLDTEGRLTDKTFWGAEWALPPLDDAFVLTYSRSKDEGELVLYVTLDRTNRQILLITEGRR